MEETQREKYERPDKRVDGVPRFLHVFCGDTQKHAQPRVMQEANNSHRVGPIEKSRCRLCQIHASRGVG